MELARQLSNLAAAFPQLFAWLVPTEGTARADEPTTFELNTVAGHLTPRRAFSRLRPRTANVPNSSDQPGGLTLTKFDGYRVIDTEARSLAIPECGFESPRSRLRIGGRACGISATRD